MGIAPGGPLRTGDSASGTAAGVSTLLHARLMGELGILIPLIGVSIPLVVVAGKFIVQPIVQAITKVSTTQQAGVDPGPLMQRLAATEERLDRLERTMRQIGEEQDFQRKLLSGRPGGKTEKTGS